MRHSRGVQLPERSHALALDGRVSHECASADRYRIHQPAARPQIIRAAIQLERRLVADIALEDLAVIADRLDRVVGPFLIETEYLAQAGSRAQHPFSVGVVAVQLLV